MLSRMLGLVATTASPPASPALEQIFDSLDTAIAVIDEQGHILAANRRWHELSGGREGALFHEHLHPGDRGLWQQATLQREAGVRLRLLTPDPPGSCWHELRLTPLHPGRNAPLVVTLLDISSRIQEMRQREAHWRSLHQLVQHLPAMLYRGRNNRHWTMEYVSAGCQALTGYPAEALTNQSCLNYGDLIHPDDAGPVWEQVQDALSRHRPFELHYRLQHADGRLIPVSEKGCGLYADNGAVLGVEGIVIAFATPSDYPRR